MPFLIPNTKCIYYGGRYFFSIKGASKYFIAPCGTLLSTTRGRLRILSLPPQTKGYLQISLQMDDGTSKRMLIHRIVAERFLFPPELAAQNQVDHLDGNPRNNAADNLEWVTNKENARRARLRKAAKQGLIIPLEDNEPSKAA